MQPTILVCGFEPFGGQPVNPAWEAVRSLPPQIGGARIETAAMPVVYDRVLETVRDAVGRSGASAVVLVGQAAGRPDVTVERVAINVDDCAEPDNAGAVRRDVPIDAHGPAAYFSTLPVRDMVDAMRATGVPASVSDTAGTYVCNHVMYETLHWAASEAPSLRAGFVHVPLLHSQALDPSMRGKPSMALSDIAAALTAGLEVLAQGLL